MAVAVGVGGAALGAYGANKQSKATKEAQNQNAALQEEQNRAAWAAYLMTRGLDPTGAQTGQIPQGNRAINTRLPLWASADFKVRGAAPQWRKTGTARPIQAPALAQPAGGGRSTTSAPSPVVVIDPKPRLPRNINPWG